MGSSLASDSPLTAMESLRAMVGLPPGADNGVTLSRKKLRAILRPLGRKVQAGIPVPSALSALADSTPDPEIRNLCLSVSRRLNNGASEADAFAEHPRSFTPTMISEIRNAAAQGELAGAFQRISDMLAQEAEIAGRLTKMAIYPIGTFILVIAVFLINLVSLVPKLETVFDMVPFGDLPMMTRGLVLSSRFYRVHPLAYTLVVVVAIVALVMWFRTYQGRTIGLAIVRRVPGVRPVLDQQIRARFLRDLARLQRESGRTMIDLACAAVPFPPLEETLRGIGDRLDQGIRLSVAMAETGFFDAGVLSYVEGGEDAGCLPDMLRDAAAEATDNANERIMILTAMLEPISTVVVGLAVSILLYGLYGGIFAMQKVMRDRAKMTQNDFRSSPKTDSTLHARMARFAFTPPVSAFGVPVPIVAVQSATGADALLILGVAPRLIIRSSTRV